MPTPSLRILIVDDQPAQCLSIERMLNQQGYYRIAPLTSFDQLMALVDCVTEPFDLLVINSAMAACATFNQDYFFRYCPAFRHVLVYEDLPLGEQDWALKPGSKLIKTLSRPPDDGAIKALMHMIDPQSSKLTCCSISRTSS